MRLGISDAQAKVEASWGDSGRPFADAVELLIDALLQEFGVESGRFARTTDGLIPLFWESTPDRYFGTGVMWFLPSALEPIAVELSMDPITRLLCAALIRVSWQTPVARSDMEKRLLSMSQHQWDWKWEFTLHGGQWSMQQLPPARDPLVWPPA